MRAALLVAGLSLPLGAGLVWGVRAWREAPADARSEAAFARAADTASAPRTEPARLRAGDDAARRRSPVETAPGGLAGRAARRSAREGRERSSEDVPAVLHVHGRVVPLPETAPAVGAVEVWVGVLPEDWRDYRVRPLDRSARRVGTARLDAVGAFALPPLHLTPAPETVRAVVSLPGCCAVWAEAKPTPSGDVAIEIRLAEVLEYCAAYRGLIVDAWGRPIPGLALTVEGDGTETDNECPYRSSVSPSFGTDGRADTETDRDGRFEVRGLERSFPVFVSSLDPRWVILVDDRDRWLRTSVHTLVAWPASGLDLRVVDEDAAPIERFVVSLAPSGRPASNRSGQDGALSVRWPFDPRAAEPRVDLTIRAVGYRSETLVLTRPAHPAGERRTVRMKRARAEDLGAVRFRVLGAGTATFRGTFFEPCMDVTFRRAGHASVARAENHRVEGRDETLVVGAFEPGAWEYEVAPCTEPHLVRTGTFRVEAGRETSVEVRFPPLGQVPRAAVDPEGLAVLGWEARSREDGSVLRGGPRPDLLPVGDWDVTIDVDGAGRQAPVRITVVEGEDSGLNPNQNPGTR